MAIPTLNGNELDNVETIIFVKDANIIPLPFPGGDSDATETFDLLGATKIITVSGAYVGEPATVKSDIDIIDALIDGNQESSYVFVSDQLGSLNVKISSFDVTWTIPGNRADYSLKLVEGI